MKNREFRELQVSSTQLAIIFFGILIVGVVIFLLGVSVGKKHAQASLKTAMVAEKAADKVRDKLVIPETPPAAAAPSLTEPAKQEPQNKTGQPATQAASAQGGEPSATPKTEPAGGASEKPPARPESHPALQGAAAPSAAAKAPGQPSVEEKSAAAAQKPVSAASEEPKKPQTKAEASPAAGAAKKGLYYVQVGALGTKAEASTIAQKFKAKGYAVVVLDPFPSDKRIVYRVRLGGVVSKEEAEALRAKLAAAAGRKVDYFITRD